MRPLFNSGFPAGLFPAVNKGVFGHAGLQFWWSGGAFVRRGFGWNFGANKWVCAIPNPAAKAAAACLLRCWAFYTGAPYLISVPDVQFIITTIAVL